MTSSAEVRAAVVAAREAQGARLEGTAATCNAHLTASLLRRHAALAPDAAEVLRRAYDRGTLSPRGHDRVVRVARTVADLAGSPTVEPEHVGEAIALRQDDEGADAPVAGFGRA